MFKSIKSLLQNFKLLIRNNLACIENFMSKLKHYDNYTKFDRVFKLNIRRNFQYLKKNYKGHFN